VMFDLKLTPGDTISCYLKLLSAGPLRVEVNAGTVTAYLFSEQKVNFFHGLYLGVLLLMMLYNAFLFATNRDRVYVYYVLYILFTALFIFYFIGYVNVFPECLITVNVYLPVAIPLGFGLFGLLFTIRFLHTKKIVPLLHKVCIGTALSIIIPLTAGIFGQVHLSVIMIQFLGVILSLVCIVTGIQVLRKGFRPARYYVVGFGAYMAGLFLLISADILGITNPFLSQYAMEIGSGIEAVMLSFAIGDKLNMANRDKVIAQRNALGQAQENERLIREQNVTLEQKVIERTAEINEQKEIIEEKQKEIVDSINYARRIQYTLLANDELLTNNLKEHFVFFKPKDIVSGDFYWATKKEDDFYLAICDCTGHGVPGSFMSLLNISFLNEAIKEKNIAQPNKVLDFVRERLIHNMEGGRDGMDATLIRFEKGRITYASANNRPLLIRSDKSNVLEADKMPVGAGATSTPFQLFEIHGQAGDLIVCFTDGFADQFGGPKGKKFKRDNLHRLLSENYKLEMSPILEKLQSVFEKWKGELEQVDDICVIGIRI